MRLVLLSSFDWPVCMGEGQPRLLLVGPLDVVPPPLGPFVTGASMLLMIWRRAKRRRKEGEERNHRAKVQEGKREIALISKGFCTVFSQFGTLNMQQGIQDSDKVVIFKRKF